MEQRKKFEAWARKFYSGLACPSETWSEEKGTYTDYAHHMAWCLWRDMFPVVEALEKDAERLDWLSMQYVVVRTPLRYGSLECFEGSPEDTDGWEQEPWDLRGKIDSIIVRPKK